MNEDLVLPVTNKRGGAEVCRHEEDGVSGLAAYVHVYRNSVSVMADQPAAEFGEKESLNASNSKTAADEGRFSISGCRMRRASGGRRT